MPGRWLILLSLISQTRSKIRDPYKQECTRRGIQCHPKAICQQDEVKNYFYCQCLPGYGGDGTNYCQDPGISITAFNKTACDAFGEQVCLIRVTPGRKITFQISVSGDYQPYMIGWYKFYSAQGPQSHGYRSRLELTAELFPKMALANHHLDLKLFSIDEDDFYPNMFWAELATARLPDKQAWIEAYDFTDFERLNPSHLRYFFVLERLPIEVGEFLEGDTFTIQLPQSLQLSPISFVKWMKQPSSLMLFGSNTVVLANGTEGIEMKRVRNSEFGYIRALVYDFIPGVPGRVVVAQRLFFIKKDISKVCSGSSGEKYCHCNPGFEGNGSHCVDKDECMERMPRKCPPKANCINLYGSYRCHCPAGFEGDGLYSCTDIDECARGTHNCNQDATCLNTLGSYFCMCQSGFIGDGVHCEAKSRWLPWSPWSVCTVTCGYQNQIRIRLCNHSKSGMHCEGSSADVKLCPSLEPCPTANSQWSEWSPWSACSHTCSGIKKRIRMCNSPTPSQGGLPCAGLKEEITLCNKRCPVDGMWSPWTPWTPCLVSCGLGVVSRSRWCNNPAPQHEGKNCTGHGHEEGTCGFPVSHTQLSAKRFYACTIYSICVHTGCAYLFKCQSQVIACYIGTNSYYLYKYPRCTASFNDIDELYSPLPVPEMVKGRQLLRGCYWKH
ncbi:PREDICTED: fibrillin-1-like isoform X3 [Gavialis gangeticus]|uniref:fibrillin-1-like isoform X3 n=1 Tax=Gavialis gangeticus TaxID=94835 RepID=UPI00092F8157|nr:PREDICTED: fibrillin-1-like isoform X3 [Gavialis gangeticus]